MNQPAAPTNYVTVDFGKPDGGLRRRLYMECGAHLPVYCHD